MDNSCLKLSQPIGSLAGLWSLLQRTTQLDHPVVLCGAQEQSHEAFPKYCPVRPVVFPFPVPTVVFWFSVALLRLCNITATPKTYNMALCQCASVVPAAAWMWRLVHFPEHKFPCSSKVLPTGLRIRKRPKEMGDKVNVGPHSAFGRTWSWKAVPVLPSQMVPFQYQGNCWRGKCSFCQHI